MQIFTKNILFVYVILLLTLVVVLWFGNYASEKQEEINGEEIIVGGVIPSNPSTSTIRDNDDYFTYVDEYVWNVGGLTRIDPTMIINDGSGVPTESGKWMGIENDFVADDDSDDPPGVGECYSLPNNYIKICFDGLSVAVENYMSFVIEYVTGVDFTRAGFPTLTSEPAIYLHTVAQNGLVVDQSDLDWSNGTAVDRVTDKIWVYAPGTALPFKVFYEDSFGDVQYAGELNSFSRTKQFAHVSYGSLSSNNLILTFRGSGSGLTSVNVTLVPFDIIGLPTYEDN
ncbi:hypothetical protein HYT51_02820, partial [Candidatus Woesearchaeota archaeon]|nr:hypothetical protein [Candidatus Woesearchaeota archaeon]